ncbi:hypothetical protein GCM10011577_22070 [Pseudarthrobacter polychromogenes]|uniref:Lipoprotein n=2 Tax=Pseudarthrobacter polychromogenes TaxID=1676 RepID=A0ABQ1XMW8_9MICC|nr:hypothetical protein GCM10011577_22070 [Pseudarthrobacter polychromogenes]
MKGIPMRLPQRAKFLLAAGAAAVLFLSACAAGGPAGSGSTRESPAVQASTASQPPSSAPASTAPAAALATFTFPDGRLSFQHPADWRVELFEASASPFVGTATVYDPAGQLQVSIYTGEIADVVATSAARTVLETDPVPGLVGRSVPTPHSSFFVDRSGDAAQYRMGLTPGLPVSPDGRVQDGLIMLGERILTADVVFDGPPFENDDAAKAWYWDAEGRTLKALLMSFSYR